MAEAWKKWEGQVVNEEFQLLRYLGGSEHSAVFLTKRADREPQDVAIKLILANAENPELQLSWWELAAKLSHPHLLRLFQHGPLPTGWHGIALRGDRIRRRKSCRRFFLIGRSRLQKHKTCCRPLLDALAYIHAKGFVHGHIKPTNIMAVGDQIKISSDGLCGAGESSRVLGAPSIYAAPEIADGGGMSPASDVWSLGMTLVEALTQSPPVSQGTEEAELVLPETLPEPFFDIASHCLRRNPQRRWTVAEITARLRETPRSAPQEPEIVEPEGAFNKWGYLVPAIAAGVLLLAILVRPLLHRRPSAEPSSAKESSARRGSAATEGSRSTPPAPVTTNNKHVSAAPCCSDSSACRGEEFHGCSNSGGSAPASLARRVQECLENHSR